MIRLAVQETPAIDVRDMVLQDEAIVTVYTPEVKMEDAFTKFMHLNMQVDDSRFISRRQRAGSRSWCQPSPFRSRCFLTHNVLEDISFETHAIGQSKHTTGSCVHTRMQHA